MASTAMQTARQTAGDAVSETVADGRHGYQMGKDLAHSELEQNMMSAVRMIGGAVITIAIVVVVVNEVLTTDAVSTSNGPFAGVITSLESTGVAAMTLLVVGLLVAAASVLLGLFGSRF